MKQPITNPFEFSSEQQATAGGRKLDYTPSLINLSNSRATELMQKVSKNPELHVLADRAISGDTSALIELIRTVFDEDTIKTDSQLLEGADEDQLSRLLESRRSDRSKAKAKGPKSNISVCRTFIASMYAELLIREYWQKPYAGTTANSIDPHDLAAVTSRIRSLQSKKSRLKKLAQYDQTAKEELRAVEDEIDRLNILRPSTRTVSKTVVKDVEVEQLREILKSIDPETLPEAEREKYMQLLAKLG